MEKINRFDESPFFAAEWDYAFYHSNKNPYTDGSAEHMQYELHYRARERVKDLKRSSLDDLI